MWGRLAFLFATVFGAAVGLQPAHADPELDRIPEAATPQIGTEAGATNVNSYLQDDVTLTARRGALVVPLPPPQPPTWEERVFFDARLGRKLADDLSVFYSGRLNLRAEDGLLFPSHENIHNDFREAYLAWRSGTGYFVELGRINLKSGVAEGYNPTDFFKTRSVVEPTSADPTVLREDRLGTFMVLAQAVWDKASVTAVFAPRLVNPSPPYENASLPSFNPMFDRTNSDNRALFKASADLYGDLSSELLVYRETDQRRVGLNLTKGFGEAIVSYLEWSGGNGANLADGAFVDGVRTDVLPPYPVMPVSAARPFENALAFGGSYAARIGITFDLEYDHHQAGFSASDWRHWFSVGAANNANAPLLDALWFVRAYAADQLEPMARNSAFLRADWPNAFARNVELTGFIDTDLRDGSGLAQLTADYYLSSRWTIGALADVYYGRRRSDFGSIPESLSVLAKLSRYF